MDGAMMILKSKIESEIQRAKDHNVSIVAGRRLEDLDSADMRNYWRNVGIVESLSTTVYWISELEVD